MSLQFTENQVEKRCGLQIHKITERLEWEKFFALECLENSNAKEAL
jgi:hypothetical protein